VGVRFGGSEHHRIETSSSHTRPPPFGVGTPGHREGKRRASAHRLPPGGAGQRARFGAPASQFHGAGQPRRFGASASQFHGAGQPRRFGASASQFHRGEAHGALRSIAGRTSPGSGKRSASAHREPGLTGTREPELFGARAPRFHRDRETEPLRRSGDPVPPARSLPSRSGQGPNPPGFGTRRLSGHRPPHLAEQGTSRSSEHERLRSTGPGNRHSSEGRPASSTGTGQPERFGAPASQFHGTGNHWPFGVDGTPPHGTGNHRPFGVDGTPPHRGTAIGTLRRVARSASPGQGHRISSEVRPPRSNRVGTSPASPGASYRGSSEPRAPVLTGYPTLGAWQTAPFGESRASPQRARQTARFGASDVAFRRVGPTADPRTPGSSEQDGSGPDPRLFGAGWPGPPRQGTTDVRRAPRHAAIGNDTDLGRDRRRAGR
jgi:hypothetical protein